MPGPLVVWGAEEVMTGASWTVANGATRALSGTVRNPFNLFLNVYAINNPAGSQSGLDRAVTVPNALRNVVPIFLRSNGTINAGISLGVGAIGATLQINLDGAGLVTSVVQESAGAGASVRGAAINVGTGGNGGAPWYLILAEFTGIPAGAGNLRIYPNLTGFATAGQTFFYVRPAWTHYLPLDDAIAAPRTRQPSELVVLPSGVRDSWNFGQDYVLNGVLRRVPPDASTSTGEESSGYYGAGADLVGVGLQSMLIAGARPSVLRYCRDRANATDFVDGYLEAPIGEVTAANEPDATIRQPITLVSTSPFRGVR
jgi:hypothetical protein